VRKKPIKARIQRKRPSGDEALVSALLKMAAKGDFARLSLRDVAVMAKVPLSKIQERIPTLGDGLALIISQLNAATEKAIRSLGNAATPHDLAFEGLMARFDYLQANRPAFLSIQKACIQNPAWFKLVLKTEFSAFEPMASCLRRDLATFSTLVLLGIYHYTLYDWYEDSSSDLSHTMSSLDKRLKFCIKIFSSASETTFENCRR
jgi:hypothetical protein